MMRKDCGDNPNEPVSNASRMSLDPHRSRSLGPLGLRLSIIALLIGVATLATLAKNGQYFPQADPAHQVSISTKLNFAYAKISVPVDQAQPAIPVVLVVPVITATPLEPFEAALPNRTATFTSTQLRSPPLA
jgi:hypothetical protein